MSGQGLSPPEPSGAGRNPAHAVIRLVVDYGGLAAFALGYFFRVRFVTAANAIGWTLAAGGHGPRDLTAATWWLVGGSVASLLVGLVAERRLAPMPLIAGAFALVFGGLTLVLHDARFIKIKPTAVNLIFGGALLVGLAMRRNPLKWLLGEALALPDAAWRALTLRYALYFVTMALLNEMIWRTQSDLIWVQFHTFGQWICVLLFSISQTPFMMKHMKLNEPPPPPTD